MGENVRCFVVFSCRDWRIFLIIFIYYCLVAKDLASGEDW